MRSSRRVPRLLEGPASAAGWRPEVWRPRLPSSACRWEVSGNLRGRGGRCERAVAKADDRGPTGGSRLPPRLPAASPEGAAGCAAGGARGQQTRLPPGLGAGACPRRGSARGTTQPQSLCLRRRCSRRGERPRHHLSGDKSNEGLPLG